MRATFLLFLVFGILLLQGCSDSHDSEANAGQLETALSGNARPKWDSSLQPSRMISNSAVSPVVKDSLHRNVRIEYPRGREIFVMHSADTGSMRPTIPDNAIVLCVKPKQAEVKEGDIVVIKKNTAYPDGLLHRVIRIIDSQGSQKYVTQGDNNNVPDKSEWSFDDIDCQVVGVLF